MGTSQLLVAQSWDVAAPLPGRMLNGHAMFTANPVGQCSLHGVMLVQQHRQQCQCCRAARHTGFSASPLLILSVCDRVQSQAHFVRHFHQSLFAAFHMVTLGMRGTSRRLIAGKLTWGHVPHFVWCILWCMFFPCISSVVPCCWQATSCNSAGKPHYCDGCMR